VREKERERERKRGTLAKIVVIPHSMLNGFGYLAK
jgi:hypothetical protein